MILRRARPASLALLPTLFFALLPALFFAPGAAGASLLSGAGIRGPDARRSPEHRTPPIEERRTPPIQERRTLQVDDLFRIRRVGAPRVSPDGRWVAYTGPRPMRRGSRPTNT